MCLPFGTYARPTSERVYTVFARAAGLSWQNGLGTWYQVPCRLYRESEDAILMNQWNRGRAERTPLLWHVLAAVAMLLSWLGVGGIALLTR